MSEAIFLGCSTPEQDDRLLKTIEKVREQMADGPITVAWLHAIAPPGWTVKQRGIEFTNWIIHSIRSRDDKGGYDLGPYVWTVRPTHGGANMMPLGSSGYITVLVLETRGDVMKLLDLLGDGSEVVPPSDWDNGQDVDQVEAKQKDIDNDEY